MAVNHDHIRRMLGEAGSPTDHTLRAKSLNRAMKVTVPTTLTPYEWEQWYAQHGIPDAHLIPSEESPPWWRQLLHLRS